MEIVLFLTKKKGPQKFSPNTNVKQPLPKPKEIITSLLPFPTKQSSSTLLSVSPVNIQDKQLFLKKTDYPCSFNCFSF